MKVLGIVAVCQKEGKEILRDPITVGLALLMPLVMLFLFGYAISLDVKDVALGVLDQDRSAASRALVDRFVRSDYFHLSASYGSASDVETDLQSGAVSIALVILPNFQDRLIQNRQAPVQILVDGTYSATANLIASYARTVVAGFRSDLPTGIGVETRVWYNPALKSVTYVVPGLFGVILMAFPPLLTALAITREKETGTIQQIFASPLSPAQFLAGKLIPYGLIAFVQILLVIAVGFIWFEVPMRGSLPLLLASGLIYVFCTVGLGLLVSTVTSSQLVAMLLALILTLMPSFLFSGFLFPIFTMPYVLQIYTRLFPAQYFVDLSRGIILKGAGLPDIWASAALLFLYTAGIFALAVWRFRKKVA